MGWCEQLGLVGLSIFLVVTFKALVTVNCFWVNYLHYFTFSIILQCCISNIVVETSHIFNINLMYCFKTCKIISGYTWSGFFYFDYTLIPRPTINDAGQKARTKLTDLSSKHEWVSVVASFLTLQTRAETWVWIQSLQIITQLKI
jgi:hypothetical protein